MSRSQRVACIGLGQMGLAIARNLLRAGYSLTGFDVDADRRRLLDAPSAASPAAAASGADVVITSLPSPQVIETVAFGPHGIHEGIEPGTTFIDMSTNDPALSRRMAQRFAALDVGALDAPVSGGPRGAEEGSLTVMVGGPTELFQRWRRLFEVLGERVVLVGDAGAGQVAKLCNNLISGVTMTAISEACTIAAQQGIAPGVLYDLLTHSVGDSRVLRTRFPVGGVDAGHPSSHDYAPLFTLTLMLKDLRLAAALADQLGLSAPVIHTAIERYKASEEAGYGELDYSAVHLLGLARPR